MDFFLQFIYTSLQIRRQEIFLLYLPQHVKYKTVHLRPYIYRQTIVPCIITYKIYTIYFACHISISFSRSVDLNRTYLLYFTTTSAVYPYIPYYSAAYSYMPYCTISIVYTYFIYIQRLQSLLQYDKVFIFNLYT